MKKVRVSEGVTEKEAEQIVAHTKGRILQHVQSNVKKDESFKYLSRGQALQPLNIAAKFWEYRHVCLNCGDVQEMGTYAIAQIAMKHAVNYTCECGHVTKIPQR